MAGMACYLDSSFSHLFYKLIMSLLGLARGLRVNQLMKNPDKNKDYLLMRVPAVMLLSPSVAGHS